MSAQTPEALWEPALLATDYDGTIALTSEPVPGGVDVNGAYAIALSEVIGDEASQTFIDQNGHNHRTPAEIIKDLVGEIDNSERDDLAAKLTTAKLEILNAQIGKPLYDGTPWPRATDGFADLWTSIYEAKEQGQPIGTAIISAGHTSFEQRTFDMWDLPQPDIFLTDEVVNGLAFQLPLERIVKPAPLLMYIARVIWEQHARELYPDTVIQRTGAGVGMYTVYIGDDPVKDGGLAQRSNSDFVLIDPEHPRESWEKVGSKLIVPIGLVALQGDFGEQE